MLHLSAIANASLQRGMRSHLLLVCGRSGLLISSSLISAHVCCRGTIQDLAAETGGLRKPTGAKPPAAAPSGSVAFVLASATSQSGAISAAAPGKSSLRLCPCLDIFVRKSRTPARGLLAGVRPGKWHIILSSVLQDDCRRRLAGEPGKPKRSVAEWRPTPLLCKRLNVADPYRGRPTPAPEKPAALPWTLADLGQSRCAAFGFVGSPVT